MAARRVIVEADGGSRGNPGDAAYGALVRDAETGEVLAERAEAIGIATNNVAEYRGLIAGLELVAEHAPDAEVEVRMDSKLVVEQMAGRWKVKHPDMRPLAVQAQGLAPFGTQWTWVPRAENTAADALLNTVLDEVQGRPPTRTRAATGGAEPSAPAPKNPLVGWRDASAGPPTTLILLRHGITENTLAKRFCGSGGSDPGLVAEGEEQARRAARYLLRRGGVDAVVSSPLRRTRETAAIVAAEAGLDVTVEDDLAEAAFGEWDGLSFAEVKERWPDELEKWLTSTAVAPRGGGESFDAVYERALRARDRIVGDHPGQTVVAVSHVTPIKMLTRIALDAPMPTIFRMELAPASLTTIQWWPDGTPSLRAFSYVPE